MAIEEKEVRHVAKTCKLTLPTMKSFIYRTMSDIIDMVEQLNEVDTTGVPVTTHGYPLVNVMREDVAEKGTDRDLLMRNVKTSEDGFIQVPAIMGENEEGEA